VCIGGEPTLVLGGYIASLVRDLPSSSPFAYQLPPKLLATAQVRRLEVYDVYKKTSSVIIKQHCTAYTGWSVSHVARDDL